MVPVARIVCSLGAPVCLVPRAHIVEGIVLPHPPQGKLLPCLHFLIGPQGANLKNEHTESVEEQIMQLQLGSTLPIYLPIHNHLASSEADH